MRRLSQVRSRLPGGSTVPVVLVLALASVIGLVGCGDSPGSDDGRLVVLTSVPIIYSLTANIAGEDVRLENILPPGASPHQVNFTPAQARLVSDADMVIINGAGLESWIEDLLRTAGKEGLEPVVASRGVEYLRPDEPTPVPGGGEGEDHEEPENVDPHVWLDASNAEIMVKNIADALQDMDPDHADDYAARASMYLDRLRDLDTDIREQLRALASRDFVSFHSAFQYYARAYGLRQVAVIEEFPGKEPSPQYLAGIVDLVDDMGVRAVFSEPQFSPRPAEALARETGAEVYEVDPEGGSLSEGLYEDLMRENTRTFALALGAAK